MLIFGALNALFMTPHSEWYEGLVMPELHPTFHSAMWLAVYLLTALVLAEFLTEKKLRGRIWTVAVILIGNALWCAVFFRLYNAVFALIVIIIMAADWIYIVVLTVKYTKIQGFFAALITCWYLYLTGLNLMIVILN